MLSTTKANIIFLAASVGQVLWPVWIQSDLETLEIRLKGYDKRDSGHIEPTGMLGYIYS